MRFAVVLLLLLSACGVGGPSVTDRLNGSWHTENGTQTIFDFDQNRVVVVDSEVTYSLDRVEGQTVFLKASEGEAVTIRLIGDNTAEWRTETTGPFILTKDG